jgi:phage-related baseplate assembly protein
MTDTIESQGVVSSSTIDLSRLPAPSIIEPLSFSEIKKAMTGKFLELMKLEAPDYTLYDSDPAAKIIEVAAYRELLLRQRVNDAAREVLLPFSKGSNLDNLVSFFGVERNALPGIDPISREPIKESDSSLLSRALLKFDEFSTAGTEASYIAKVKEFGLTLNLSDVKVYNPRAAGRVRVVLLFSDHSDTGSKEASRKEIDAKLQSNEVKPLTDDLSVVNATIKELSIKARILVEAGVDKALVLDEAIKRLSAYRSERYRIGSGVSLSGLYAALTVPNVVRVDLLSINGAAPENFDGAVDTAPLISWDQTKKAPDGTPTPDISAETIGENLAPGVAT